MLMAKGISQTRIRMPSKVGSASLSNWIAAYLGNLSLAKSTFLRRILKLSLLQIQIVLLTRLLRYLYFFRFDLLCTLLVFIKRLLSSDCPYCISTPGASPHTYLPDCNPPDTLAPQFSVHFAIEHTP